VPANLPRLRQAVLAAGDLDVVVAELRSELDLGEPFADPGVSYFGLRNAVFALGDTFLEVVCPTRPDTSAGRLLERRGGDCGYMLMFQLTDLGAARERVREQAVREVFEVSLDDISEVHLHPADMRGAIVALSEPSSPDSWRWGGPDWASRAAQVRVIGARVAVAEPDRVAARWTAVLGESPEAAGVSFIADKQERGPVEIMLSGADGGSFSAGGVRFTYNEEE
jgi:hypothetical protein